MPCGRRKGKLEPMVGIEPTTYGATVKIQPLRVCTSDLPQETGIAYAGYWRRRRKKRSGWFNGVE